MRFVDSKGRLFGIVNLLDLMVIIVMAALIAAAVANFISSPRANKTNVDMLVKILYRVPREVALNKKILRPGDTVLSGNAVIDKVLGIKPIMDKEDNETHMNIVILIKAKCVMLGNEYYCANMPIKVNSPMTISNPFFVLSSGIIIDVETAKNE